MSNISQAKGQINTLDLALNAIKQFPFLRLFPVHPLLKGQPLLGDYLKTASNMPAQLKQWHAYWKKRLNGLDVWWGIAPALSGLVFADVDTKAGKVGEDTFERLDQLWGWPETRVIGTPSGGRHHWYRGAPIFEIGRASTSHPDIDFAQYVILPGCMKQDGTGYTVREERPIADAPEWFYQETKRQTVDSDTAGAEPVVDEDQAPAIEWAKDYLRDDAPPSIEGAGGDDTAMLVGRALRDMGISEPMALDLMLDNWNDRCEPPWQFDDLKTKVANVFKYARFAPGGKTGEADFADDAPDVSFEPKGKPEVTAAQVAERAALARMDAARTPDERDRKWTKPQVCEEIVYVTTLERFFMRADPSIAWKVQGFNNKFGYLDKSGKLAQTLFGAKKATIRKPDSMVYKPTLGEFVNGSWNQWRPSRIVAAPGDTSLWDAHVAYLFPDPVERGHLLDWLAGVLQQQQVKPMHALLLVGKTQGTGKSFIIRVLAALIGERNWQALTQDILANGFTGWSTRTKLVTVEELRAVSKTEIAKKLHPWITQREMTVNEKNLPTFVIDQCIAFAFMSNKPDAIELDNSDRRYLILETMADVHPDGPSYYQKLYGKNDAGGLLQDDAGLGAILYQLMNRDLGKYDIAGPAPWTAAKVAMKDASANDIGQWIKQHIGQPPFSFRVVTDGEIIAALPKFMQNRITMKTIREALEYLGGISWPTQIEPDGSKGNKLRVWLLGEAADRCRERKWLADVGKPGKKFPVLQMYREDHGPGVAVVNVRMIGEDDAPALLDFGDAADDFEDAYSPVLEPVIDPWD